jgi:MinD-like ATPase involved in chromosome partitioning or flagellar assembly
MITFDRVLPELIRICQEDSVTREGIARYCVVRDIRGRARLVVEPKTGVRVALDALGTALSAALSSYFVPPILATDAKDEGRLARALFDHAKQTWPSGWPTSSGNVLGGAVVEIGARTRWLGIERTLGKEAWLATSPPEPPWPLLNAATPPIVTFHSYKGGVGRTTLVAAYAIWLANGDPPRRVAVIDLDLEAPGIGSLLGAATERGVLDVLVDHIASGKIDLEGASSPAQLDGDLDRHITVFSAGSIGPSYIQKLARLDYSSTEPGQNNPVGAALGAMLKKIKSQHDVILLDARAGLHDLAGMSLHGLAHVDVLVFRSTEQNLAGLAQTLRTLGDRARNPRLVLVETLLPADEAEFEARRQRTRAKAYELLCGNIYDDEDLPQLADVGVAHDVVSVRRRESLDALDSFQGRVQDVLQNGELAAVAQRIDEACARDQGDEDDNDEGEE